MMAAKASMLTAECRVLQEEFMSAYGEQLAVLSRQDGIQKDLEECGEDMERMSQLLDELQVGHLPVGATGWQGIGGREGLPL